MQIVLNPILHQSNSEVSGINQSEITLENKNNPRTVLLYKYFSFQYIENLTGMTSQKYMHMQTYLSHFSSHLLNVTGNPAQDPVRIPSACACMQCI